TFFTFSLSPIRDETGVVVGLFHPVTETTTAMLNQRRTRLLRDITSESANSDNVLEAVQRIARTLTDYKSDIPGAIIFLEKDPGSFELTATSGDVEGFTNPAQWPIDAAIATSQPYHINNVVEIFGELPCSEYHEPIQRAWLLPIKLVGYKKPIGFIAATLSTRLPYDESYMAFFDMLSSAVSAVVTNALANESVNTERVELQTDIHDLTVERNTQVAAAQILRESKNAAEAATRSKSAFLANMSHEIRTPLTAILGFAEILKSHDIEIQDRDKYLNIISRNGHSLVRIIDDILDLSKIEAGKIQLEKEPLCLTELIQDVVAMFSDRVVGKGLSLSFDPSNLPHFKILSDVVRVRQILINLLGNAIKFTSEGGVFVRGHFKPIEDSLYEITLCITDTGIGITPEQGATLFQAFTQADNETTRHFGGTGLGLALSQRLAIAMGGDVSIEKNSNVRGTTFLVKLITAKAAQQSEDSVVETVSSAKVVAKRLNDWSILVVDDSEDNRLLMKVLLEREGAIVHEASSGRGAIRKAHESDYDVVLMDIQMPELDGYQALAELRNQNYKKPIFALTAHTMKEEKDRALAAGFSGHIAKPVNRGAVVETLLAHSRSLN
ncbi:MAG: response regulator, partial [Bdellovibrionota bacterium]